MFMEYNDGVIIDLEDVITYSNNHLPNSINIPYDKLMFNYKEYLDGNFNVYEYDSYQELYNSVIKVEIVYDLNDLELFDENGNWNFYITFEELKKVGYGFMVKD